MKLPGLCLELMEEKPLILVTNDDGFDAPGIRALAEAMAEIGDVYTVAPDSERRSSSPCLRPESWRTGKALGA